MEKAQISLEQINSHCWLGRDKWQRSYFKYVKLGNSIQFVLKHLYIAYFWNNKRQNTLSVYLLTDTVFALGKEVIGFESQRNNLVSEGQGQQLAHFSFSCLGELIQQLMDQGLQSDQTD